MQKLGILASVLLLAAAVITPVGLSYAQTVDTSKEAKMKHEEIKAAMEKEREQRLEKQRQMAAEAKAKMEAKKAQAAKEIEQLIKERKSTIAKEDLPQAADIVAKLKEMAKEAIDAKKPSGGPSKVQKALEADREALKKRIEEFKKTIPVAPQKDIKYTKEDQKGREKTLKTLGAQDQLSKEQGLKKQYQKAEQIKKEKLSFPHP